MADLRPFRGIFYDFTAVRPEDVLCPPAQHLSPLHVASLRLRSARNAAWLLDAVRPPEETPLETWRREGTVRRDAEPSYYALSQSFRNSLGGIVERTGLLALCRLREFSEGVIVPHQRTIPALLEEAVRRLQGHNAHAAPVALLLDDSDRLLERTLRVAAADPPVVDVVHEGVILRIRRIPALPHEVQERLDRSSLILACGHHAYEAALTYRDMIRLRARDETVPADFIPAVVLGMHQESVVLRPVFRLVRLQADWEEFLQRLSRAFQITSFESLVELAALAEGGERHAFGIVGKDRLHRARRSSATPIGDITDRTAPPELRELDVSILHHFILGECLGMSDVLQQRLEHLYYAREIREAAGAVQRGEADLAFITGPLGLDHLRRLTRSRSVLPPATTFLAPSIPSGAVMHRLDEVPA